MPVIVVDKRTVSTKKTRYCVTSDSSQVLLNTLTHIIGNALAESASLH